MAKQRVATGADRAAVRARVLSTLAAGEPLEELGDYLWSLDGLAFPSPADALCELGADALALAGASRSTPVSLDGIYERFLPGSEFRGNTAKQKRRVALELVIAIHAGIEPDYYEAAGWWRVQDLVSYTRYAVLALVGLAAERTGSTVAEVSRHLDAAHSATP
jgi:hypothetical protein